MIINIRKVTLEDRFARKYYCNSYRFVHDMKRRNRRKLRRIVKQHCRITPIGKGVAL